VNWLFFFFFFASPATVSSTILFAGCKTFIIWSYDDSTSEFDGKKGKLKSGKSGRFFHVLTGQLPMIRVLRIVGVVRPIFAECSDYS
jgi:hypothetical protein